MPKSKQPATSQPRSPSFGGGTAYVAFPSAIEAMLESKDLRGSQAKQALVKDMIIPHRKFKEAVNVIAKVHKAISRSTVTEAEFSLIAGRSRAGKSTAIRWYAQQFAAQAEDGGMRSPVVYLEAPSECTVLSLLDTVLGALKVPTRGLKTRGNKIDAIVHHLREQKVELLIIDEYQHFVDARTNRFQQAAGDLLKGMLNKNCCQMLFAGLLSSDSATTVNSQAEGRLNERYEMGPYIWKVDEDNVAFRSFLKAVANRLPFDRRFAMEDPKFAIRIYVATDGLVGRVMRLTAKATEIAADRLARSVTMADFAAAFDAKKKHGVTANPFRGAVKKVSDVGLNLLDDRPDPADGPTVVSDVPMDVDDQGEGGVPEGFGEGGQETQEAPEDGDGQEGEGPETEDEVEAIQLEASEDDDEIDGLLKLTLGRLEDDSERSGLRSARAPRIRDSFSKTRA